MTACCLRRYLFRPRRSALQFSTTRAVNYTRKELEKLELKAKKLPPNCQLHLPEASAKSPEKPAITLLVGWTGSRVKALRHFAPLYTKVGIPVLCLAPDVWSVWFTSKGNKITSSILRALDESIEEPSSLVLHILSGAGTVVFPKLCQEFSSKQSLLTTKFTPSCAIFDSGPSNFSFKSGTAASKLMYKQDIVMYAAANAVGITTNLLFGARKRSELKQALRSELLNVPQLYLHSVNDPVSPPSWVEGIIREQRALGREVSQFCWQDSDHVRLYRDHPLEYEEQLGKFLTRCKVLP